MKINILSIVILIATTMNGMAHYPDYSKTIIRKDHRGLIRSIEYTTEDKTVPIPKSSDDFFKSVLRIQSSDRFERTTHQFEKEYVHERYVQFYNGVRVDGCGFNFHFRKGIMEFANGYYIKIDDLNTNPTITSEEAKTSFSL